MTCFVSKPSRITLVELSIINTSYQKLPSGSAFRPSFPFFSPGDVAAPRVLCVALFFAYEPEKYTRRFFWRGGLFRRRRFFLCMFRQMPQKYPDIQKKSAREITKTSSSHVGEKESPPCATVFGEKIGMLLCRLYVVSLNFPLATRTRHLSGTS